MQTSFFSFFTLSGMFDDTLANGIRLFSLDLSWRDLLELYKDCFNLYILSSSGSSSLRQDRDKNSLNYE